MWVPRHWLLVAVGVYVLAVGVRLAFLTEARHNPLYQHLVIDEQFHDRTARAILVGKTPPTAYFRAPGQLYFLAGVYRIFGAESLRARVVQVFVAGLAPVLLLLIGGPLFGPTVGAVTGLLASVFWTLVFFSTELLDVTPACVVYLLLAWAAVTIDDGRGWKWPLCGCLLGLGAIVRPNILAFAPVWVVMIFWRDQAGAGVSHGSGTSAPWLRTSLVRSALLLLGCLLTVAPVGIRNLVVAGEPVLISAWGSGAFWATNNPSTDARHMFSPPLDRSDLALWPELREEMQADPWLHNAELSQRLYIYAAQQLGHRPTRGEAGRYYARESLAYVRQHPLKLLGDVFRRLCYTFNAYEFPFNRDLYRFLEFSPTLSALSWLHFGVICPFGVLGLLPPTTRRVRSKGLGTYVALLLTLALSGTLFPIFSRYRLPVVYLLMPFVALGLVELARTLAPPIDWRRAARRGGVLVGFGVFCNVNVLGFRPAQTEYLHLHFISAYVQAGRHDLAIQTADEVIAALEDSNRARRIQSEALCPMFEYLYDQGEAERAARFGWEMVRRDLTAPPRTMEALVKTFIQLGDQDRAATTLETFERSAGPQPEPYLAQALLRYGRAYRDRDALTRAYRLYGELVRLHPNQERFRNALSVAARLRNRPASTPSPAVE